MSLLTIYSSKFRLVISSKGCLVTGLVHHAFFYKALSVTPTTPKNLDDFTFTDALTQTSKHLKKLFEIT